MTACAFVEHRNSAVSPHYFNVVNLHWQHDVYRQIRGVHKHMSKTPTFLY